MSEALVESKKTGALAIATERRMRAQWEAEPDAARAAEYRLEWERQKAACDALLDALRELHADIVFAPIAARDREESACGLRGEAHRFQRCRGLQPVGTSRAAPKGEADLRKRPRHHRFHSL